MSFQCPFLIVGLAIYHSHIGAQSKESDHIRTTNLIIWGPYYQEKAKSLASTFNRRWSLAYFFFAFDVYDDEESQGASCPTRSALTCFWSGAYTQSLLTEDSWHPCKLKVNLPLSQALRFFFPNSYGLKIYIRGFKLVQ